MFSIKRLWACVALLLFTAQSFSQYITGPAHITTGPTYSYSLIGGVISATWSVSGSGAQIVSQNTYGVTIKITQAANCSINIHVAYSTFTSTGISNGTTDMTVLVDPFIKGPTIVYPGETNNFTAYHCYLPCGSYSWTAPSYCTGCSTSSDLVGITVPSTSPPTSFTLGCYLSQCFNDGWNGNTPNLTVAVKLRTPTITSSGPTYCNTPVTLTASTVTAATSYTWTVPPGWTTISSTLNTITVIPNGSSNGTFSVVAHGGSLSSDAGSATIAMNRDNSRHNLIAMPNSDVFYIGTDQHIHRLYWTTTWNYDHLVPSGGWGTIAVEGWMTKSIDNQSIYFKSVDKKLYALTYPVSGGSWTCSLISTTVDVTGNIAVRQDGIFYIGSDNLIHRVYQSGGWVDQTLNPLNWQGITINGNLALAPYPSTNVYFTTTSGRLYNLYGDYNSIEQGELPTSSGCSGDITVDPVSGRVYFRSSDKIHYTEWVTNVGWQETAISATNTNYTINGYMVMDYIYQKIYYKGMDTQIHNLYHPSGSGPWVDYPLTNVTNGYALGDIVLFDGKLIYVNTDNTVHQFSWIQPSGPWYDEPFITNNVKTCSMQYSMLTKEMEIGPVEDQPETINDKKDETAVTIYPNPSRGQFTIDLGSEELTDVYIFDMLGNKVKNYTGNTKSLFDVDLSSFPKGVYFIKIIRSNEQINKKIVLE